MTRALVVLADGFEEIEALAPIDLLRRAGVAVTIAGLSRLEVVSKRLVKLSCDVVLSPSDYDHDALILPGGLPGAQHLADSPLVQTLTLGFWSSGKIVAAICAAPSRVLGPLGILKGRKWSGFPGTQGDGWGGSYQDSPTIVDGALITGRAAGTAFEFSLALIEQLCGQPTAAKIASEITWEAG